MKLTSDNKGRLTCADLFPPRTTFDAQRMPDGAVRVVELVEKEMPIATTHKVEGFILVNAKLDRKSIRAAIRADRDAQ